MEYKALKFSIKNISKSGEFEGYAAAFGNKDSYGDIIQKGAFKRTIDHHKGSFPILWMHDPTQPFGISTHMEEDDRGLYTKGIIDLDNDIGRRVYSGMKHSPPYIDRLSIGYRTKQEDYDKEQDARILKEVQLLEISMITKNFAANDQALITSVKQIQSELTKDMLTEAFVEAFQKVLGARLADSPKRTQPKQHSNTFDSEVKRLIDDMKKYVGGL